MEKLATMLPVEDMAAAVALWSAALGAAPTFVDGERWAQFDLAGSRLALAGSDRAADRPGVMAKVADLDGARRRLLASNLAVGPIEAGPHERRFAVDIPGSASLVFYQTL